MILLFIGPPGSGKDTQADILVKNHGFTTISTGDLFRKEMAKGSELGKRVESYMKSGQLVPDDIVYEMLGNHINELNSNNIVLNAVVRNVAQIALLDELLSRLGKTLDKVVYFKLEEEEAIKRLLKRKREDDDEATIRIRMRLQFRETIPPILEEYKRIGKEIIEVDAMPAIEIIAKDLEAKLGLA